MENEKIYKIILLGDGAVGKTSIRYRYMGMGFRSSYLMTLGADFSVKRLGKTILHIWDIAGTKAFSNVRKDYYRGANGALLIFDIIKRSSFDSLNNWIEELISNNGHMIPTILIANKVDLIDDQEQVIPDDDITQMQKTLQEAFEYEFPFIKTSALTGFHIEEAFKRLITELETKEDPIDEPKPF